MGRKICKTLQTTFLPNHIGGQNYVKIGKTRIFRETEGRKSKSSHFRIRKRLVYKTVFSNEKSPFFGINS